MQCILFLGPPGIKSRNNNTPNSSIFEGKSIVTLKLISIISNFRNNRNKHKKTFSYHWLGMIFLDAHCTIRINNISPIIIESSQRNIFSPIISPCSRSQFVQTVLLIIILTRLCIAVSIMESCHAMYYHPNKQVNSIQL